jgi:hypothetical protein
MDRARVRNVIPSRREQKNWKFRAKLEENFKEYELVKVRID